MLNISEIFGPTIQGEGKYLGVASIFIRVAKCNFTCKGFEVEYTTKSGEKKFGCDTYYAVDSDFKDSWEKQSSKDIIKRVNSLIEDAKISYKIDIVITGGEPLLYWMNSEFQELLEYFIENNHRVTIETNASISIKFTKNYQKKVVFSTSVKLSNSKEEFKKRVNIENLKNIFENSPKSYLKFVVDAKNIKKIESEIDEIIKNLDKPTVYLMPKGSTNKELKQNSKEVINLAIKRGFLYSDRIHIRIWDDKRGV